MVVLSSGSYRMTNEIEFRVEKIEKPESGAVVYRFSGVMGETQSCYDFLEEFLASLPSAPLRVVFNLGALENMYSSGIGIVANCYTKADEAGKTLVLADVPKVIERTLTLTGIQPMVKEYTSEAEALSAP